MPTGQGGAGPKRKHRWGITVLSILTLIFMVTGATLGFTTFYTVTSNHELSSRASPLYYFQVSKFPLSQSVTIRCSLGFITDMDDYFAVFDLGATHPLGNNVSYDRFIWNNTGSYIWLISVPSYWNQTEGFGTFSVAPGSWIVALVHSPLLTPSVNASDLPPVFITVTTSSPVALVGFWGTGSALAIGAVLTWRLDRARHRDTAR